MTGRLHFSKAENEVEPLTVSPGECSTVSIRIAGATLGKYILLNIDVCSTCYCTYFFKWSILTLLFDQNSI